MSKVRLDTLLVDKGLCESREKAKAVVMSGMVYVNNQKSDKPGTPVAEDCTVEVRGDPLPFVSRGGYKLDKALKVFPVSPEGKVCLDCGASTGGFTDVLLQHGAREVYSVDVGYGQLAWKLRNDPRVHNLERTNLRYVTAEQIPSPVEFAACDVSFISLQLILPAVWPLLCDGAPFVLLIKPQFEAGRELVGKKGVVRDRAVHEMVVNKIISFCSEHGYPVLGLDYSPVRGPEGNIEFLLYLQKGAPEPEMPLEVGAVVQSAHEALC